MTSVELRLYSKPRGPGDQTSGGRGKLLNTRGDLNRLDVLVRETLQNSWDAADHENWYPAYGISIRRAAPVARDLLRKQVFTGITDGLKLGKLDTSLKSDDLHVVEIFDRGTTGLNGPVRPAEAAPPGAPNNFNAFVFDIGTTKPQGGAAGGTYGFGKTATFEASAAHAVVYWTRCDRGDGVLEDRLIASALHDEFDIDGKRYTGAHWWGDPDEEQIVPLCGNDATELGEALFETHFGEDETGTSILLLAPTVLTPAEGDVDEWKPVHGPQEAHALGKQMLEALVASAWPKVVPFADDNAPMTIQFSVLGEEADVASIVADRYSVYAHGLATIRSKQHGEEASTTWPRPLGLRDDNVFEISLNPKVTADHPLEEYFGERDDRFAGHLYMAKVLRDPLAQGLATRKRDSLCLMRSETEIVVTYTQMPVDDGEMYEWFGVFKPTPECDHHFAAAEPATHDAWITTIPDNPVAVYVVNRAMQNVNAKVKEFIRKDSARRVQGESRSARGLSRALNSFVPTEADLSVTLSEPGSDKAPASETTGAGTEGSAGVKAKDRRTMRHPGKSAITLKGSRQLSDGSWEVDFDLQSVDEAERIVQAVVKAREWGGEVDMGVGSVDIQWAIGTENRSGPQIAVKGDASGTVRIRPHFTAAMTFDLTVSKGA